VVRAPDGTIWKVATPANKDTGPATRDIDGIALVRGVSDMTASKRFYVERGLTVAKSYGSKYVEFEARAAAIKLALYKRGGLAKDAGVSPAGTGSQSAAMLVASQTPTGLRGNVPLLDETRRDAATRATHRSTATRQRRAARSVPIVFRSGS
jgi:hypothetical protein